jgi:hypothetical protein
MYWLLMKCDARFELRTAVSLRIQVLWTETLCCPTIHTKRRELLAQDITFSRNK